MCLEHDAAYAVGGDLPAADFEFIRRASRQGLKGALAALGVTTNFLFSREQEPQELHPSNVREGLEEFVEVVVDPHNPPDLVGTVKKLDFSGVKRDFRPMAKTKKAKASGNLRGGQTAAHGKTAKAGGGKSAAPQFKGAITNPPTSLQMSYSSQRPIVTSEKLHHARIRGHSFVGTVKTRAQSAANDGDYLGAVVPLAPACWGDSFISTYCKLYEKFRFHRLRLVYMPEMSTSTNNHVVLSYNGDPANEIPIDAASGGSFLPNIMSRENSTVGPLWSPHYLDIPVDPQDDSWRYNDGRYDHNMSDLLFGYAFAFTNYFTAASVGQLIIQYDLEFHCRNVELQGSNVPRTLPMKITAGTGTPNAGNDFKFNCNAGASAANNGGIAVLWIDTNGVAPPTGPTDWNTTATYNGDDVKLDGREPLYGVLQSGQTNVLDIYPSYTAAVSQGEQLKVKTTISAEAQVPMIIFWIAENPELVQ